MISWLLFGFTLLVLGIFTYYLFKFNKQKSVVKKYNKIYFSIYFILSALALAFSIVAIIIYVERYKIFNVIDYWTNHWIKPVMVLDILATISLVGIIILLFFFVYLFAIKLTDKEIQYLGEKVEYSNIVKIILDDKTKFIYINFKSGKRTYKRIKYSPKNPFTEILISNAKQIGHEIENGDANAYFKKISGRV